MLAAQDSLPASLGPWSRRALLLRDALHVASTLADKEATGNKCFKRRVQPKLNTPLDRSWAQLWKLEPLDSISLPLYVGKSDLEKLHSKSDLGQLLVQKQLIAEPLRPWLERRMELATPCLAMFIESKATPDWLGAFKGVECTPIAPAPDRLPGGRYWFGWRQIAVGLVILAAVGSIGYRNYNTRPGAERARPDALLSHGNGARASVTPGGEMSPPAPHKDPAPSAKQPSQASTDTVAASAPATRRDATESVPAAPPAAPPTAAAAEPRPVPDAGVTSAPTLPLRRTAQVGSLVLTLRVWPENSTAIADCGQPVCLVEEPALDRSGVWRATGHVRGMKVNPIVMLNKQALDLTPVAEDFVEAVSDPIVPGRRSSVEVFVGMRRVAVRSFGEGR